MLIKGIRSFSPDNQNVIEFYKPLTLIVGHNGAGKTTVIECLKMACTGELPPNTRSGQSFIHDPKVAGETEVKAQIKLRFMTSNRQPVVIIRSFQLTQKKSTMQFKALDNVLQTVNRDTGQKEALSYRCADIDRIVPQLMGVSKAVLENVIFVHQEESNWPLAEGQVLKKKFDDIFAATKYTKALEALRKLRTEKAQEVKELKLKLEHTKTLKDQAAKLRGEEKQGRARLRELQEQIGRLDRDSEEASTRLRELATQLNTIADLGEKLSTLRTKFEMQAKQNAEAYNRLVSLYGEEDANMGADELQQFAATLEPALRGSEHQLRKVQRDVQVAQIDLTAMQEQYTKDVKAQGRLAAEADAHARNLDDFERSLADVCAQAGVQAAAGNPQAALDAFQARLKDVAQQLDSTKAANRQTDDNLGQSIDQVARELSGGAEAQRMKREQISRNANKAAELQAQMQHLIVNPAMLEASKDREREADAKLTSKQQQLAGSTYEEESRKLVARLAELAAKASQLRVERDQLSATAEGASRLRFKLGELAQKQSELDGMLMTARMRLAALFSASQGDLPQPAELHNRVATVVQQRQREVAEVNESLKRLQGELSSHQGSLSALRRQLAAAQDEQGKLAEQLRTGLATAGEAAAAGDHISTEGVKQREGRLEEQYKEETSRLGRVTAFAAMAQTFKDVAHSHNKCQTCDRGFGSVAERQAFLAKQDTELAQVPYAEQQLKAAVDKVTRELQMLRGLQPAAMRHDTLARDVVPDLQRRVADCERAVQKAEGEAEEATEHLSVSQHELEEARRLLDEVAAPVNRLWREIQDRTTEVDRLKAETASSAATRTVSDVDQELEDLERDKATAEGQREELQRRHNRLRDEMAHLRSEQQAAREESLRLGAAAEKRAAIEAQIRELSALNEQLQKQASAAAGGVFRGGMLSRIEEAQAARQPLEQKRSELVRAREAKRAEMAAREGALERQLRQLHTWDTQLAAKQRQIREYTELGKAEQLARVTATLESLAQRQKEGEDKLSQLQQQQKELERTLDTHQETKRQVDDLLAYQEGRGREAELGQQLESIGGAQDNVGNKAKIEKEYGELEGRLTQLRSERDQLQGRVDVIRDRVNQAREEGGQVQYQDIDARYRMQLVEQRTTEMANSDLEKYHKALEKALLSFHTSKMADINKIVKELWQKTYRNQDIDYIQIKADQEGAAGRSYNYRVVMHTGGAELDMRGRCSAGQKVLACLIIRLALAETFCLNCGILALDEPTTNLDAVKPGILALDEPTTNLDADNSASLAEALRNIMMSRRDQENFQLVVITHDEQFARLIGTREHAEYMWRITKDEAQRSTITQEDIME
ncbi:hypothetical protein COHA_010280 [Chlorella ohadii]|uniref:DNA repair protein RAD50 n=1 Tax=Chlorella ohadii TaxID=2649997 RepID=A0AAD5DE24_9CHLO|nr:hypothetical protein COHA_010280 [Chlorella ohadii]